MDTVALRITSNPAIAALQNKINQACADTPVPPCLLAAIVWRESRGRNVLQVGVPPGDGCGVGLCQITYGVDWSDVTTPKLNGKPLLDEAVNLRIAITEFLSLMIGQAEQFKAAWPTMFARSCQGQIAYAAAAAYNAGWSRVEAAARAAADADTVTTGGNYASDVFATYISFVNESHG